MKETITLNNRTFYVKKFTYFNEISISHMQTCYGGFNRSFTRSVRIGQNEICCQCNSNFVIHINERIVIRVNERN